MSLWLKNPREAHCTYSPEVCLVAPAWLKWMRLSSTCWTTPAKGEEFSFTAPSWNAQATRVWYKGGAWPSANPRHCSTLHFAWCSAAAHYSHQDRRRAYISNKLRLFKVGHIALFYRECHIVVLNNNVSNNCLLTWKTFWLLSTISLDILGQKIIEVVKLMREISVEKVNRLNQYHLLSCIMQVTWTPPQWSA